MTPERWQQVKEIFHSALQHEPEQRSGFLSNACGGDELLRQEVESLISSHEKDGSFINSPAYEAVAGPFADDETELKPGQTLDPYEIVSLIGKGGMGVVYLAEDKRLGRKVALKFLSASFLNDPDRLRRFEQEARAASALNQPNILTIHEIGETDGRRFIATEYVEGETLRQRLVSGSVTLAESLGIAEQVASALTATHAAGIIHRDIKPENVMLRRDGLVKVLDFGLAKLTEQKNSVSEDSTSLVNTKAGLVMGTVAYMSPEQARGLPVDARTDIWSLGVVLYEMLSGCSPFTGATSSDTLVSILEREPKNLTSVSPEIPEALEWIVTKALTKERDDRYQTGRELLTDLRRLKHRLDLAAEIERSVSPERAKESGGVRLTTVGPNIAPMSSGPKPIRISPWIIRGLPAAMLVALVFAVIMWNSGAWFKRVAPDGPPVVTLMDSPLPDRVYDPETRKNGGTNADDLTDILRDLPINIQKENTSALWHREDQVLRQKPALIIIHRSCFADAGLAFDPQSNAAQLADSRVGGFLGYISLGNPRTRFLVYSRRPEDQMPWASDLEKRFPQLEGRIVTMTVPGGPEHATFRDATTAQALRQQVQAILGLQ
jgi:serine/threonine protein kinase